MYFLCGFGGTELGVVVLKIMLKLDCLSVLWKIVEYKGLVLSEIINDISLRVIFEKNNCKINFKFFFSAIVIVCYFRDKIYKVKF